VAICGATGAQILAGARSTIDRNKLTLFLGRFHQAQTPESWWGSVGENLAALNARGLSVPFGDAVIVTVGMESDIQQTVFWRG
jgi:hypothetical protein